VRELAAIPLGDICEIRPKAKATGSQSCPAKAGVNPRPGEGECVQSHGITLDKPVRLLRNLERVPVRLA